MERCPFVKEGKQGERKINRVCRWLKAFLYETAKKNIDGEITVDEAGDLINSYFLTKLKPGVYRTLQKPKCLEMFCKVVSKLRLILEKYGNPKYCN